MLLEHWLPTLPGSAPELLVYIAAAVGVILVVYSQFVEAEHRRDLIRMIGAACLLVYALYIRNLVFSLASGGIFIAAAVEFIEIYTGVHKHNREDLKRYFGIKK